jgi:hypothetical protein
MEMEGIVTPTTQRRLWLTAGSLMIGYVVLTFAGVAFEHSLMLGDKASSASAALVHSSMTQNFAGGYIEYLASLVFLVGALLLARLLRGDGVLGEWLSSCIAASATVFVAITVTAGFAAGAAALYDGHHGAALATVTTVNDIRNFAFFLSGGLVGVFAFGVAAAARVSGRLPQWVSYSGVVVGVLYIVTIPAAANGVVNVSTMLGFAWLVALGVAGLRESRTSTTRVARKPAAAVV